MFKLESYITPILLSYVDKYIKNFRPQDSQVSLWGGDASFHNLDLRLEVLEQELQLPFSFVSGHIHELLIHVPWTKLASEPITITINTIECILKLRGADSARVNHERFQQEKTKRNANKRQQIETPPGYVQLLINKIVSNIRIYCNNLILKYVEEDIVLSMNVKLLTFESANEKWEPAYTDVYLSQLLMRKVIAINDLTVCLDKRNASGKIDVYQEPMLYRCSMVIHFLRSNVAGSKKSSSTRCDIYCNSMEFSMTEQQIPMLLRLIYLLQALHQKQLKSDHDMFREMDPTSDTEYGIEKQSLAGWAWSFVPSLLPVSHDDIDFQAMHSLGPTLQIGFYVDNASLTFKVSESHNEKSGYYTQRKLKYWPLLTLRLQGIFTESIFHGKQWSQVSMGISEMVLLPIGQCSCSLQDVPESGPPMEYLKAGQVSDSHKTDSLFDVEAPENKGEKKIYHVNWNRHIERTSEASLLERSPAVAMDYLYQLTVPDDMTSENLSELGSDLEFSNLSERALLRIVVGPLRLAVCSGFLHRMSSLRAAASTYDYLPYSVPKPEPELSELLPPSEDDYDALNEHIPDRVMQFTFLAPVIEVALMDHPHFEASKHNLFKKRKKVSTHQSNSFSFGCADLPKVTFECQCFDVKITNPMYTKRLLQTTCQLPDPPEHMFDACYTKMSTKVIGFCSRLLMQKKQTTILTPSSASYKSKTVLMPQYWVDPNIPHHECVFESESFTITGTNPKILMFGLILDKLIKQDTEDALHYIGNSSLSVDAVRNHGLVYLELCVEGMRYTKVTTQTTITIDASLGSIKAFIIEPIDFINTPEVANGTALTPRVSSSSFYSTREIQQVLIISGPEFEREEASASTDLLLTATIQVPLNPEKQTHPPLLLFNLKEIKICIDPLLCRWLLYTPKLTAVKTEVLFDAGPRKLSRTYSDNSVYETPRRSRTPYESIHSSLDQATYTPIQKSQKSQNLAKEMEMQEIDSQEKVYNFLKKWFDVWKGLLFYGDISQCTVYFPVKSLSAVGSQGIQQAVQEAMKKEDPPDIFVFTLPSANIRNSSHRDNLNNYLRKLPIVLPDSFWSANKSSFPWNLHIADLSCYTWQDGMRVDCLAPVSLTSTVGMSTKSVSATKPSQDMGHIPEEDYKSMENIFHINFSGNKSDIGTFGVCVHIDMTPIVVSISEPQVCLIASILHGLIEVAYNILPEPKMEVLKIEPIPSIPSTHGGSNLSPTILKESIDSLSEKQPHVPTENLENDNIKLTAWIQWTITRFTVNLLAHENIRKSANNLGASLNSPNLNPNLKFVIDAEDIVSSLDFQNVYLKLKSKIGSASIMHYVKDAENRWHPGEFLGLVLRVNEEPATSDRQEDTSFATITITRASCQHTHNLWGANKNKKKPKDRKEESEEQPVEFVHSRYMTEIMLSVQPIDLLVSPVTLKNYFLVLEPLLQVPAISTQPRKVPSTSNFQLSNRNLPLTYIEFNGFRMIMPSADMGRDGTMHNTCVFQVNRINLSPSAVNPICRTPCRPDIYQQAAQARILNIPGSEMEDRQYQLDIHGICMNSGSWTEISQLLKNRGKSMSVLKTMSENPALEWNNLGKGKLNSGPEITYWSLISKFDISVIYAPAMIYKTDIICGHSIEVNFISDINFTISLDQIKLIMALTDESIGVFDVLLTQNISKPPKVFFPYPIYHHADGIPEFDADFDLTKDSGIETSDMRSYLSLKTKESSTLRKMSEVSEKSVLLTTTSPTYVRSSQSATTSFIPMDVLITGGKVSMALYEFETTRRSDMSRFFKENESEKGYEASEEESVVDEKMQYRRFIPLLYFSLSQPNAYFSDTLLGRKIQISCFDVCIKVNGGQSGRKILKGIPTENDFSTHLLETKSGEPHVDTGVLPAFLTLKWSKGIGKPATLDVGIAKPTKIVCSFSRWLYLLQIQDKFFSNIVVPRPKSNSSAQGIEVVHMTSSNVPLLSKSNSKGDHYVKYEMIKKKFRGLSIINLKVSQLVISLQTKNDVDINLSFCNLTNNLSLHNRPEKLLNSTFIDCLSIASFCNGESKLILNPWSASFEVTLFWESWQSVNSSPQIQISVESDSIVVDISPDKILNLQDLLEDVHDFGKKIPHGNEETHTNVAEPSKGPVTEKEQHYKDDLRAGAFHFVDSTSNNIDELPLPYQVVFWNRNVSAMAWRYPQPRALTKVRVFPVPFKISTGNEENEQILCHLEYWSDCHGCYQTYTQFYLSETEMCHLELPKNYPQPAVACTWRVVLTAPMVKEYHQSRVLISPRALAGCIRVDSYFNKNLIPQLTLAVHVVSVNINLINYFDKRGTFNMPAALKKYSSDLLIPEYQHFLTLTIDNANAYLATWKFEMAVFDIYCNTKCSILDYAYLTHQQLFEPFAFKFEVSLAKTIGINLITHPIRVLFGAGAAHTLAVSAQIWTEILQKRKQQDDAVDFIVLTRYVVCNDTNLSLRFGQAGLEDIFLQSRYCHLYSWRSQKSNQMLRVGIEENRNLAWSEPFAIDKDGTESYQMGHGHTQIIVTIRSLSATQKQVTFSGQLYICNTLLEHFEVKVVQAVTKEKEREFKITPSHIIRGKSTPPSMLLDCSKNYFLRLRFYGLESAWSGDIPLLENTKCAQPWLVKVPLQERGQFLSIWCRIVTQDYPKGKKILAMLWPLFMIRFNLPISAKLHIETPTLNVHLESTVKGHGELQQLYCPGTIDHSHQLTFQLDNALSDSNPYVPLNYSLVDQKQFFKKTENEDIADIVAAIDEHDKNPWPYFQEDYEDVDFIADDQPLTHVQVRYQNASPHSSALLVELLPWSLMVNMLGCQIAILINEKELCRMSHNGIITPPKLEDTFCIAVGLRSTWNVSSPLQLAKSNWSQAFYMPSITGTIPFDGHIKTVVHCEPYVCVVSILSSMYNEIRLLRLTSSHVLTNHLKMQLYVMCFAVPDTNRRVNLPSKYDSHSFVLPPQLDKINCGVPIMQWLLLENPQNNNTDFALYMSFATNFRYGWSCPTRVDKLIARRSIAVPHEARSVPIVLVAQECKGQTFLAVHHDLHPQLLIENRCGANIFCAQFNNDHSSVTNECEHIHWICTVANMSSRYYSMPVVSEKFPELPHVNYSELLVLAASDESDLENIIWSTPINVTNFNDQFVRIPYHGDVKAVVQYTAHAVKIRVESVSQVEISARDIRVRLTMHEKEAKQLRNEIGYADSSTPGTSYFSAEESAKSSGSLDNMMILRPDNYLDYSESDENDSAAIVASRQNVIRVMTFIKGITFTLTGDLENGGTEKKEVISISCDNIALTVTRAEIMQVSFSVSTIQVDNQLFTRGSYDFPVILVSQNEDPKINLRGFNVPINQLIYDVQDNNVIRMDMNIETWKDVFLNETITDVSDIHIKIQPISIFLEDIYLLKLMEYLSILQPTKLVIWQPKKIVNNYKISGSSSVPVPRHLKYGSNMLARPVRLKNFSIDEISILLSVHASVKLYIALDQSPLHFGKFDKRRLFTTYYRLGHAMTMHYVSGAIFGAGWVVSSLELIGSPGGLARAMGSGLRDFVSLPYHGLVQGPWAFLRGVSYGSASLMKHVTAGTLQSVTKLASSVARNLDRLTLDEEHLRRTEESRRQRPQGLTQGFVQGLTGLGISLLGAVGGIAHHPLQSVMAEGASPRSLVAGVGRGIVGVFTKPLSGAAELVALTGQGLLQGAGWNKLPEPRMVPVLNHIYSSANSIVKYKWKFLQTVTQSNILFVTEATAITNVAQYDAVALVLTSEALIIVDIDEDMTQRVLSLSEIAGVYNNDPTLLCLKLEPPKVVVKIVEDDVVLEMDPACRARVADYVRNTVGLMHVPPDRESPEHSEMSISPDESPVGSPGRRANEPTMMTYYVSPQNRNYFLCLLSLAKQQVENYYFPVL